MVIDNDNEIQQNSSAADEITAEFESIDEEENAASTIKKLREKLKACEKEKASFLDGWQRSKADFVNAKRAFDEERKSLLSFAESGLIEDILPALDSFYAARKNKDLWESIAKEWRLGVEYIEQQLKSALQNRGLEIIEPTIGSKFNHETEEAVSEADGASGTVVEVRQPGYSLKGKLLRAARVVVGK
jgi:molecular chaperone GrpE